MKKGLKKIIIGLIVAMTMMPITAYACTTCDWSEWWNVSRAMTAPSRTTHGQWRSRSFRHDNVPILSWTADAQTRVTSDTLTRPVAISNGQRITGTRGGTATSSTRWRQTGGNTTGWDFTN